MSYLNSVERERLRVGDGTSGMQARPQVMVTSYEQEII